MRLIVCILFGIIVASPINANSSPIIISSYTIINNQCFIYPEIVINKDGSWHTITDFIDINHRNIKLYTQVDFHLQLYHELFIESSKTNFPLVTNCKEVDRRIDGFGIIGDAPGTTFKPIKIISTMCADCRLHDPILHNQRLSDEAIIKQLTSDANKLLSQNDVEVVSLSKNCFDYDDTPDLVILAENDNISAVIIYLTAFGQPKVAIIKAVKNPGDDSGWCQLIFSHDINEDGLDELFAAIADSDNVYPLVFSMIGDNVCLVYQSEVELWSRVI